MLAQLTLLRRHSTRSLSSASSLRLVRVMHEVNGSQESVSNRREQAEISPVITASPGGLRHLQHIDNQCPGPESRFLPSFPSMPSAHSNPFRSPQADPVHLFD